MSELLDVSQGARVLEAGTGSGYQAAVLAVMGASVFTIEIVPELSRHARDALEREGYTSVRAKEGDGYIGWKEHAPFDRIIVTAAPEKLPDPLWEQLRDGERIVMPVGPAGSVQELVVVEKGAEGKRVVRTVIPVRFVPLQRRRE
jgi:protein-L-isoaspartate(D-aspartate) O-methyltransferase